MFENAFTLVVEDLEPIKQMLADDGPTPINIDDEYHALLSMDEESGELQVEPFYYSYH